MGNRPNWNARNATPQPPVAAPKAVKYSEAQEHVLRRLGAALVVHWDAMPDELQDLLIDQASLVDDRADAPHDRDAIEGFLRSAKVTSAAPPAAAQ